MAAETSIAGSRSTGRPATRVVGSASANFPALLIFMFVNASGSVMFGGIPHCSSRPIAARTTFLADFDSSSTTG